jgi:hypothetical protein
VARRGSFQAFVCFDLLKSAVRAVQVFDVFDLAEALAVEWNWNVFVECWQCAWQPLGELLQFATQNIPSATGASTVERKRFRLR